ncbi:CHASE2 domain-containing protein [Capilliphycus salinus ALCB114379]|uniref:CHASE2 domain-containing protein n=1 Tax=Capilliphycus salinus TaxID=2768948 RepID=UPI0039A48D73
MGSALLYWCWVRLNTGGKRQVEEIPTAKAFFQQQFPHFSDRDDIPDTAIQKQLVNLMRSQFAEEDSQTRLGAESCLRCFISQQIDQTCLELERRFGEVGGFNRIDLLPFVLNDFEWFQHSRPKMNKNYESLADKILRTFNPERSQLNTWTARLVKSQPELNRFLWDCGVHLQSDWSILNNYHPKQLERLLVEVYNYSLVPAQKASELLDSYQAVYLSDRLQKNRSRSRSRCQLPTSEQLNRILANLEEKGITNYTPDELLEQFVSLAELIRRSRQPQREPLCDDNYVSPSPDEAETQTQEFLQRYRQLLVTQLDQTILQVLNDRLSYLKQLKPPKDGNFLQALQLSRKYLARLLDHAAKLNVNVIGIDYLLNVSWPEEDQVLEKSLMAIKNEQKIQSIFITSRDSKNERRWTLPKFADQKWQGDSRVWENGRYMTLLPCEHEERPFPLSYLLALAYKTRENQTDSLQETSPILLRNNCFSPWMRPRLLTRYSYQYYQYWLHPIVDFSIPQSRVYESISAKEFLETQPEQLQKQYPQSVMMIVPGGYANAGINRPGEDNFPAPPAFCYWQKKSQPNYPCRILLGGEIHAYLFHHFLEKKSVVPVPDLWFLWLFALAAKGLKVAVEQYEISQKKVIIFLSISTLIYGFVCLQLYIYASVFLPIIIPLSILCIYLLPEVNPRKSR